MKSFRVDLISEILNSQPCLILDGGLATELEAQGTNLNTPLWSAALLKDQPELVKQVHLSYLEAGADCLTTATYQASFEGFLQAGISREVAIDLMQRSVDLANEAVDEFMANPTVNRRFRPLVAASIGPYGAFLADGSEYRGNYGVSQQQLREFHAPRLELLASLAVDILAFETIPSMTEADVLLRLLTEYTEKPAWICFSCRNEHEISDGTPIAHCANSISDSDQILAAGINCTAPQYIQPLILSLQPIVAPKHIIVYPNSGETYSADERNWFGSRDVVSFAERALIWQQAGAKLIGGCCRTGPEHIRAIKAVVKQ